VRAGQPGYDSRRVAWVPTAHEITDERVKEIVAAATKFAEREE
jgi:hypothetical protein